MNPHLTKSSRCLLLLLMLSLGCKTDSFVPDRSLTAQEKAIYEASGYTMLVLEMRAGNSQTFARLLSGKINPLNSVFTLDKDLSGFASLSDCADVAAQHLLNNPDTPRRIDVCYYLFSAAYQSESNVSIITNGMAAFSEKLQSKLPVTVQVAPRNFTISDYSIGWFPEPHDQHSR